MLYQVGLRGQIPIPFLLKTDDSENQNLQNYKCKQLLWCHYRNVAVVEKVQSLEPYPHAMEDAPQATRTTMNQVSRP